jgi:hypothetical protein
VQVCDGQAGGKHTERGMRVEPQIFNYFTAEIQHCSSLAPNFHMETLPSSLNYTIQSTNKPLLLQTSFFRLQQEIYNLDFAPS